MIVCSCNVLSDQDVRSAVEAERTRSTSRVYGCLGAVPGAAAARAPSAASWTRRSTAPARHPATAARGSRNPDSVTVGPTFCEYWSAC